MQRRRNLVNPSILLTCIALATGSAGFLAAASSSQNSSLSNSSSETIQQNTTAEENTTSDTNSLTSSTPLPETEVADISNSNSTSTATKPEEKEEESAPETFNKQLHSISEPNSLWIIVNKLRPLPATFAPENLVFPENVPNKFRQPLQEPAAQSVEELFAAAKVAGHQLQITSAYRDYNTQRALYQRWANQSGTAAADNNSARAGHSEHQTGLAVDIHDFGSCYLHPCFGDTPAGKWLAENAHLHGFILRYPEESLAITGFNYEPWHFRFVGKELAKEMQEKNISTLEEFFELPPAPNY